MVTGEFAGAQRFAPGGGPALAARFPPVQDSFGRSFGSLRLSVTPACNMSCAYCNPERLPMGGAAHRPPEFYLELVARLLGVQHLAAVHITGGEPGLYRELPALVRGLQALGIPRVSITTNGVRLRMDAEELSAAGLSDCNVSLDAISRRTFERMTGCDDRNRVLSGIEECLRVNLPVKVNCTVMRGRNDREIVPLFSYVSRRGVVVRFLELMKMGPLQANHAALMFPESEMLVRLATRFSFVPEPRHANSTARYWRLNDGRRFGIIANHSTPFCSDCDRLRLSHDGRLFGCISSERSQDLMSAYSPEEVRALLEKALVEKQAVFRGSALNMQAIGG